VLSNDTGDVSYPTSDIINNGPSGTGYLVLLTPGTSLTDSTQYENQSNWEEVVWFVDNADMNSASTELEMFSCANPVEAPSTCFPSLSTMETNDGLPVIGTGNLGGGQPYIEGQDGFIVFDDQTASGEYTWNPSGAGAAIYNVFTSTATSATPEPGTIALMLISLVFGGGQLGLRRGLFRRP